MKRQFALAIVIIIALAVMKPAAMAAIPDIISYQGELKDGDGNPVNGTFAVTFTIYDALAGGTALWMETQNVAFSNGLFTIRLGEDGINNPIALDFSQQYWLGISIDGEAEFSPRTSLTSSPYSFRAKYLDGLTVENIQQFFALAASIPDADGDGHNKISMGGDDCDDADPDVHPGAPEYCDGIDNNCNGIIDDNTIDCPEGMVCFQLQCIQPDNDGDGYPNDVDCDDSNPFVYPGAPELCDGFDNDCNGIVDDNTMDCPSGSVCVNGVCTFIDNDGDGYPNDVDCDDSNPFVYPGAPELCDGFDNDCDSIVDDNTMDCPTGTFCVNGVCTFIDNDGDGWPSDQDCDDNDPNTYPGAPEICGDLIDNNCDGTIDEGCP